MIIGMLHHRKDPQKVTKAYAFAAVAQAEGAELLYFSPGMVDLSNKRITGWVYTKGNWQQVKRPFPDVIYNAGSPLKLARAKQVLDTLQAEIPFTTYSIGNKMRVYQRLKTAKAFGQYLIPSEVVTKINDFFDFLEMYQRIIFKPVNGRKGEGVTLIERIGNEYHVHLLEEKLVLDYYELKSYFSAKIKEENYMVQPYISCKNKLGQSYDFRLHLQKDGTATWVITSVYPRIGAADSIISNINSGGSTNYCLPFLKQEFGDEYFNIKCYLEQFALQLAQHMDQIQGEYFAETIDEIGIDVGLDDSGKLWIYEVNWRPGSPPAFYLELDVVKNMIRYAMFLAAQKQFATLSS